MEHERKFISFQTRLTPNTSKISHRNFRGTPHLVVPVVAFKEGVFNELFSPAVEIELATPSWAGRPVPIHHPQDSSGEAVTANSVEVLESDSVIGKFMNTQFVDNALQGEFFFDLNKANKSEQGKQVVSNLKAGRPLDVSVGFFSRIVKDPGAFGDKEYTFVARDHKPDHVAVLLEEKGACSQSDGCGVGMSDKNGEEVMAEEKPMGSVTVPLRINVDASDTVSTLDKFIDAIKQAFSTSEEEASKEESVEKNETEDKEVSVSEEEKPESKESAVSQDVNNKCACKKTVNNDQEDQVNMEVSTLVGQLIDAVPSLENHKAELESFDVETLESLADRLIQKEATEDPVEEPEKSETTEEPVAEVEEDSTTQELSTEEIKENVLDQYAAKHDFSVDEMTAVLSQHTRKLREHRANLVKSIVNNSEFSAEELKDEAVWTVNRLEKLAASLSQPVEQDYLGRGGPTNNRVNREEGNPAPELTFTKEERGFLN